MKYRTLPIAAILFVTAFIGRLHLPTGQLTYCNAGHLPPLLVKDGQCRWFEIDDIAIMNITRK